MEAARHMDLIAFADAFEGLQRAAYKEIVIDGAGVRILGINLMDIRPGWTVSKHRHTFFEFHYVAEGTAQTIIGDREQKVEAGSFYLMPPGTRHGHRQESEGHVGMSLRFEFFPGGESPAARRPNTLARAAEVLREAHSGPVRAGDDWREELQSLFAAARRDAGVLQLQLQLVRLVLVIGGYYGETAGVGTGAAQKSELENAIVENALRFMEENHAQELGVRDVAGSVHTSYSHLARLFRKYTGASIVDSLNGIRLKRAQKLLLCSNKSLAEIAAETGFGSQQYFCSLFCKAYGFSPGRYRRQGGVLSE